MTPAERLKEIEKWGSCLSQDEKWLIARVKRLTRTLETIANDEHSIKKFGLNFEGYCLFARKALEDLDGA